MAGAAALSGGFGLAGPGAGGGAARTGAAWLAPHSSRDSRLVQLTAGRAEATTTLAEPGGYLLLARVSAPAGMRVEVQATQLIPDAFSAVVSTFRLSPLDSFLSCRVRAGSSTCTQGGQEFCPLFSSAWRVHVVKEGGPSGPVQVDLVVGQRPVGLSVAQTDTWVARYDSAWTGRAAPS